jgi:hypothetical protein
LLEKVMIVLAAKAMALPIASVRPLNNVGTCIGK